MEEKPAQKKATLYLNMILGDFEPVDVVKRCIDSVKDGVDGMYITVTYTEKEPSPDHPLVKLLQEYKVNISYFKWNYIFADARNFAMQQVPMGPDKFIYWQDADDVLRGSEKLHTLADGMLQNKASAIAFTYWYQVDFDEKGDVVEVLVEHKRERIVINDGTFKWIGDLHEVLIQQKEENIIKYGSDDCLVVHYVTKDRSDAKIERNIKILEEAAKKQLHKDPRTLVYLARAYLDKSKASEMPDRKIFMDLALTLFHEYLNGSGKIGTDSYRESSGWREERATAWSHISEIAIMSNHIEVAVSALQSAIDEAPEFPNYYIDLAWCYVALGEIKKAKQWLNMATATPVPDTTIITLPRDMKTRALEVSWQINMHEKKLDFALEDAEKLAKILKNDKFAQEKLKETKDAWFANKAAQSIVFLGKYLEQTKERSKIKNLLEAVPQSLESEKFYAEMRHLFLPPRIWEKDEITILCGPGFEEWSPKSVETGIGGSEEAVIYISKELAKLGWRVTVYGNPGRESGEYDGVKYTTWHNLNPQDQFNVLLLWRGIGFVDVAPTSQFSMLWMHDVPNNADFTKERLQHIDKIAVLSEYHKSLFRMADKGVFKKMPEEKLYLTANGINEIKLDEWKGNPHRMIYMSSPDRGLVYLLRNWKKIRAEVPDAELHIFYGFRVYDAIHTGNPGKKEWKDKLMVMMKQDGITYHDRIGHDALNYEISQSGIWAYPTDFTEISCISAMKAQANGAIPVVTDFAALRETVRNGIRLDVDITTEEGQKEYVDELVALLKDPQRQSEMRKDMMPWAQKNFLWSNVAKSWDQLFRVNLQNPTRKLQSPVETEKREEVK